jgi:DNA-binding NarL/FixJ family response regulator
MHYRRSLYTMTDKARKAKQRSFYEGKNLTLSTKIEQLEWRRSKVVEMRARGMSQTEIARDLQVSNVSISLDIQYLRNPAN